MLDEIYETPGLRPLLTCCTKPTLEPWCNAGKCAGVAQVSPTLAWQISKAVGVKARENKDSGGRLVPQSTLERQILRPITHKAALAGRVTRLTQELTVLLREL